MPRVSVVLNCYNQAGYVAEAVESVLGQSYRNFELIAVDNGSTDATPSVLARYEADPRVRLFLHRDNTSVTRRFNQAVAAARGEFVSFLYSDDYFLPGKLERQVACFDALGPGYGVVYGPARGYNQRTGRFWDYPSLGASGEVFERLCLEHERGPIDMVSPLTRAECLRRYPFYEDVFAEGEGVFFRVALAYRFAHLGEPLVVLRDHGGNAGKAIRWNAEMTMEVLDRVERHDDFRPGFRPALNAYRRTLHRNYGWQAVRCGGDVRWARRRFAAAVRLSWAEALHYRVVGGLAMSFLPAPVRGRLNAWGDRVRGLAHNSVHVESGVPAVTAPGGAP